MNQTGIAPGAEQILLVDDRPANLMVYRTILEELNQTLVSASSGEEALKLVLKQDFAVILLDVNMPTMSGFETASLIRKRKKSASTPIIFLTAHTDEMNIIQGYESGAVDFMPTPVMPEVLKAKVRVFIELARMKRLAAMQAEERARREAAEDQALTFAFMAKVSEDLARVKTRHDFMRTLVRLPVPDMAEAALVWFKNGSQPDSIEWASSDETLVASPAVIDRLEPAVARAVLDGRPGLFADVVGGALSYAQILPLIVQGRAEGVLVLGSRQMPAQVSPLAGDLAARASLALENIMLLEQVQEADRRKDEFLGMLAHELRNPLGPIYNCLQLQRMLRPDDTRQGQVRETIERQVKHMGRLVDDLLDATRLAHGKILLRKERCDLAQVVRQTVEDYRNVLEASSMVASVEVPAEPVWIEGDPTRLVQVVGNLLHNAHKFSHSGGTIAVRLERDGDTIARISVTDAGIGIEPQMLQHVFDVFRQAEQGLDRSRGGLGLGLALVKGLVALHGGSVEARSDGLNTGAEFRIRLPVLGTVAVGETRAERPVRRETARRILVIDDNRDAAESLGMLLQHDGHDVEIAFGAEEGLRLARDHRPEVILCDIGLPVMDGYQVIRQIRADKGLARAYVMALTGYGREEDQKRSREAGFDLHLTKPIDRATLTAALEKAKRRVAV